MKQEKACGCIIIKNNKVLLVYEKSAQYWGFPKGHVENNETEIETASREVKEEVGLDVHIDTSKRYEINYCIGDKINKTSVFFLATPKNQDIKRQETEIQEIKWCEYEEALKILGFDNLKDVFKKVIEEL